MQSEPSLRNFLGNLSEQFEQELDQAFQEGRTQERVYLESLFGLNGVNEDAFGNVSLEDVAPQYADALELVNNEEELRNKAKQLLGYTTAESQPDGFAGLDLATGDVIDADELDELEEDAFSDGYDEGYEDAYVEAKNDIQSSIDEINEQLQPLGVKINVQTNF